jgi:hypothetical protein
VKLKKSNINKLTHNKSDLWLAYQKPTGGLGTPLFRRNGK